MKSAPEPIDKGFCPSCRASFVHAGAGFSPRLYECPKCRLRAFDMREWPTDAVLAGGQLGNITSTTSAQHTGTTEL